MCRFRRVEWGGQIFLLGAQMLVLSRKKNEQIIIADEIVITIVDIRADKVRIGIEAPAHIPVHRQEVYLALQERDSSTPLDAPKVVDET